MSRSDDYWFGWYDAWRWLANHRSPTLRMVAADLLAELYRLNNQRQ